MDRGPQDVPAKRCLASQYPDTREEKGGEELGEQHQQEEEE